MHHQLQVEIQRRLLQEKELQDAYKQLEGVNAQHQGSIHELTTMLDLTKRDNDALMQQVEEYAQEIERGKEAEMHAVQMAEERQQQMEEELQCVRQMYEEIQSKQQTLIRENDYLKTRVEVAQQIQAVSSTITGNSQGAADKLKDLEDNL